MTYISALQKRYASKRMNNKKISIEKLHNILEAIQLSPSSYGLQPYKILVIQNDTIKKEIQPLCNNQAQIIECDALLIFTGFTKIDADYINIYIRNISEKRNIPMEKLEAYKNIMLSTMQKYEQQNTFNAWTGKQTYLALGFALTACALEGIDSCPIEGFDATSINDYFKLPQQNMYASVMLAIGHKDESLDFNSKLPKYRKSINDLIIWK